MSKQNNQVIIERDMFCPYCNTNSAVLISETVKNKKIIGCALVGLKNGCLLTLTGGCWAIICGFLLIDEKEEHISNLYGFCPCCGNTYPVTKPEFPEETFTDKVQGVQQKVAQLGDQISGLMNRNHEE